MTKKKILIITFSCVGVVILAVIGLLLGLNWNKIASWFNGAQVYTYEEIQAATEDAYNKGVKERDALIKQVEDYKSQVDKLLTKVDSLNVDVSLKDEEILNLKTKNSELENENSDLIAENTKLKSDIHSLEFNISSLEKSCDYYLDRAYNAEAEIRKFPLIKSQFFASGKSAVTVENNALENLEKPNENCVLLCFDENRNSYQGVHFENVFGLGMDPVYLDVSQDFTLPAYAGTAPEGYTFVGWSFFPLSDTEYLLTSFEVYKAGDVIVAGTIPQPVDGQEIVLRLYAVFVPIET